MLNLNQNLSNTVYSFFTNYTGVAPYTLSLISSIDANTNEDFVLSLTQVGERVSYAITPTLMTGTYHYKIKDTNGKIMEQGVAVIES